MSEFSSILLFMGLGAAVFIAGFGVGYEIWKKESKELIDDVTDMAHTVTEYTATQSTAHKEALAIKQKYKGYMR